MFHCVVRFGSVAQIHTRMRFSGGSLGMYAEVPQRVAIGAEAYLQLVVPGLDAPLVVRGTKNPRPARTIGDLFDDDGASFFRIAEHDQRAMRFLYEYGQHRRHDQGRREARWPCELSGVLQARRRRGSGIMTPVSIVNVSSAGLGIRMISETHAETMGFFANGLMIDVVDAGRVRLGPLSVRLAWKSGNLMGVALNEVQVPSVGTPDLLALVPPPFASLALAVG